MAGTITHKWNGTVLEITSDSGTSAMDLQGKRGDTGARGARGLPGKTGGGALIEDSIISDETTWSSAGIMNRFAESMSVEGNPVQCEPIPNMRLHVLTEMQPKQEGSGEPYPAGGGRNLLGNYSNGYYTGTRNGLNVTPEADGTLKITGTPNKQWNNLYEEVSCNIPAGEYVYSYETDLPNTITIGVALKYSDGTYVDLKTLGSKATLTGNVIGYKIYLENTDTTKNYNNTLRLQLEKGTTVTAYQPFENIRPIRTMEAVKVIRCGKNLAKSIYETGYTSVYSNCLYVDADIMPNTTYTISFVANAENANRVLYVNEVITAYKDFRITGTRQSITFTTKETISITPVAGKGYIIFKNGTELASPMTFTDVQLEQGETATAFEPYKGNTYTIDLGSKYAQGVLDWNTGVLTVESKVINLNGNEVWKASTSKPNSYYINQTDNPVLINNMYIGDFFNEYYHICSHYKADKYNDNMQNNTCYIYQGNSGGVIHLKDNNYTSVEAWKTYLIAQANAGKQVQVCYKLAEPITIQLTPQEIYALKDTNTLYTDADKLQVIGRVDTMKQLSALAARVAALEALVKG